MNAGGAMRHARHKPDWPGPVGAFKASPQRTQKAPVWLGNSSQQASQIGTKERRGSEEPQRTQEAGRSVQPRLSRGLRSTRTTARHREVSESGTSVLRMPESWKKTHLASGLSQFRSHCVPGPPHSSRRHQGAATFRRIQQGDSNSGIAADRARCAQYSAIQFGPPDRPNRA